MNQKLLTLSFVALWCVIFFSGCPDSGVNPPAKIDFSLSADEVVSTEALITIHYASPDSVAVNLKRSGEMVASSLRLLNKFTFDDTLLEPNQNYSYTAYVVENNKIIDSTSSLHITTLDTTSHDWKWETTTFGGAAGSCIMYDCVVVNDTLAYAVGKIILPDSTGQNEVLYNAAKWNGKNWDLVKIYYDYNGQPFLGEIRWVFAINENDIWFGNSVHWDGKQFHNVEIGTSIFYGIGSNKMWGSSNGALYVVGNNGTIAFSSNHGTSWQPIESGTITRINDIWGIKNRISNEEIKYCAVTDFWEPKDKKILKITNATNVDSIPWNTGRDVISVWSQNDSFLYACGDGVFKRAKDSWKEITTVPNFYTHKIRGNAFNDIVVCGSFGLISHFNGLSWHSYSELYNVNGGYSSIAIRSNLVLAVGLNGASAIVTIGKRN